MLKFSSILAPTSLSQMQQLLFKAKNKLLIAHRGVDTSSSEPCTRNCYPMMIGQSSGLGNAIFYLVDKRLGHGKTGTANRRAA
jgi:hypothetical protein